MWRHVESVGPTLDREGALAMDNLLAAHGPGRAAMLPHRVLRSLPAGGTGTGTQRTGMGGCGVLPANGGGFPDNGGAGLVGSGPGGPAAGEAQRRRGSRLADIVGPLPPQADNCAGRARYSGHPLRNAASVIVSSRCGMTSGVRLMRGYGTEKSPKKPVSSYHGYTGRLL